MVENCIGKISLPVGLALNFNINGDYYTIPMAVEEPSIIAASSSAAKFIDE
jgi:hydroxymethylglutaryl-CoA reductase